MNTVDDIIAYADKMWIDGHTVAIQDIKLAEKGFLNNLSKQNMPELLYEIKTEVVKTYTEYIIKFVRKQNKMMIDSIVEE